MAITGFAMNCVGCYFQDTSVLSTLCQPDLGYHAFLFMTLIEMTFKTKCFIADPCRRIQSAKLPNATQFDGQYYDYVIVGGGVAGKKN